MKRLIASSLLVVSIALSGCAQTDSASDARSVGRTIDDASLTARVKTAIARTQSLAEAAMINVDSYRGVVSLAGFVGSAQQMRDAVTAARQVSGVEAVKNNMEIKPSSDTP